MRRREVHRVRRLTRVIPGSYRRRAVDGVDAVHRHRPLGLWRAVVRGRQVQHEGVGGVSGDTARAHRVHHRLHKVVPVLPVRRRWRRLVLHTGAVPPKQRRLDRLLVAGRLDVQ